MSSVQTTTNTNKNPSMSDWLTFSKGLLKYIVVYLILGFWVGGSYIIYLNKLSYLLNINPDSIETGEPTIINFYNEPYNFTNTDYLKNFKTPDEYFLGTDITTLIAHYFYTCIFHQTIWLNHIIKLPYKLFKRIPEFAQILLSPILLILFFIINIIIVIAISIINFFYVFLLLGIKKEGERKYTTTQLTFGNFFTIMPFWSRLFYDIILFILFMMGLPGLITFYMIVGLFVFFYILSMPGIQSADFSYITFLKQVLTKNSGLFYWIFTYGVFSNFSNLSSTDGIICLVIMLLFGFIAIVKPFLSKKLKSGDPLSLKTEIIGRSTAKLSSTDKITGKSIATFIKDASDVIGKSISKMT